MAAAYKVYTHSPRPWRPEQDAPVECRVCGIAVYGPDPSNLWHADEAPRLPSGSGDPAQVVAEAAQVVEEALSRLPGETHLEAAARTAAEALYWCGALRAERDRWAPPKKADAA
jgi:hypothetical protein